MATFRNCIFRDCSGSGIFANNTGSAGRFTNCNFWNNTADNVHLANPTTGLLACEFEDCLFGKAGGAPITIHMTIVTPDANSFRRSQGQLLADAHSAAERARRRGS